MIRFASIAITTNFLLSLSASPTCPAAAPPAKPPATRPAATFAIPGHGSLELPVPDGWKSAVRQPPRAGLPPTIELTHGQGKTEISVQITAVGGRPGDADFNKPDRLKQVAELAGKRTLAGSKETELTLEELKGEKAAGYCFTLTDKAPNPGSFEYVTPCFVGVGDLMLAVTILHHEKASADRTAALAMLKSARQQPGAAAASQPAELRLRAPGATAAWELVLPAGGMRIVSDDTDATGKRRRFSAVNESAGLMMSVFMEPAAKPGDSAVVRDVYWGRAKQSPLPKQDIKLANEGEFATVEYLIADVGGQKVNQKNLNVYAVHEGVWIDVHVSKMEFEGKDQGKFDAVVKGAKFEKVEGKK